MVDEPSENSNNPTESTHGNNTKSFNHAASEYEGLLDEEGNLDLEKGDDKVLTGDPSENETEEEIRERKRKMREYEQNLKQEIEAEEAAKKAKADRKAGKGGPSERTMAAKWFHAWLGIKVKKHFIIGSGGGGAKAVLNVN